jgi:hypothetical protein
MLLMMLFTSQALTVSTSYCTGFTLHTVELLQLPVVAVHLLGLDGFLVLSGP